MSAIPQNPPRRQRMIVLIIGLLAATAGALFFAPRIWPRVNPQLNAPTQALASLAAKSLYYNGAALPWLRVQRPDLLVAEDRDERSERARGLVQAVENGQLFRQLDRRYRFDTLLLVGDPSLYRPLLEHLLEAKDWTLTHLDHACLIYKREAPRTWQVGDLEAIAGSFAKAHDQAVFWAQAAVKLLAIRRGEEAKALLDRAAALDEKVPEVWNALAIYRMNRGEWTPAKNTVDRALALDADFLPAIATKTQILYSTKKFNDAYALSTKLIAAFPDDPGLLFYHAKICHEAHAYTAEVRTLRRLIERAEAEARPAAGYRIYLAQAYAAAGQAQPSIEEFRRALEDRDLSAEQRKFAETTLAQIRSRTGLP